MEHLHLALKEINMFIAKDTTSKTTKYYSTNFDHIQSVQPIVCLNPEVARTLLLIRGEGVLCYVAAIAGRRGCL